MSLAELHRIIKYMRRYGGSFVKALATLLEAADEQNTQRILRTWPEYIAKYQKMAHEDWEKNETLAFQDGGEE